MINKYFLRKIFNIMDIVNNGVYVEWDSFGHPSITYKVKDLK